uniref:Secreted protein n=2 Tax=Oryza TaxID=4527 RepID=A0A0D3F7C9_9ORYZ
MGWMGYRRTATRPMSPLMTCSFLPPLLVGLLLSPPPRGADATRSPPARSLTLQRCAAPYRRPRTRGWAGRAYRSCSRRRLL